MEKNYDEYKLDSHSECCPYCPYYYYRRRYGYCPRYPRRRPLRGPGFGPGRGPGYGPDYPCPYR
ncbi:MAG: hypothetical protein FH753_04855 [Firmicutes bacterium]|nr:hypothetical protein [Bacillota bacterium]